MVLVNVLRMCPKKFIAHFHFCKRKILKIILEILRYSNAYIRREFTLSRCFIPLRRFYIEDELGPYFEFAEGADTGPITFCCDTLRRVIDFPDEAKTITEAIKMDMEKRCYLVPELDNAPWEN